MSVVGIGTDIIDIRRIAKMNAAAKHKLVERLLAEPEQRQLNKLNNDNVKNSFIAKRWAAKEAVSKALGTGIANGVSFQHIIISSHNSGAPIVELNSVALEKAKSLGARSWHISLSDEKHYACAFAVLSA